jgi:2-polyprenyl-6-methoxyphenol hydroxylase-like FAD-dependent oxidoreductase
VTIAATPGKPDMHPSVVVVGAGPTGLLLAVELVRRDVGVLLIDGHDAPLGWDRATIVHARSIEIFEALGLAAQIVDRSVKIRAARMRSGGITLGEIDLGLADRRYGFDLGLSENETESVLTGCLEGLGGAVARSARLVEISKGPDGVVATIEQDGVRREVTTSWIVGCDGLHSTTRQLAGIGYPGADLDTPWAVFDATLEGWDQEFDACYAHFDVPALILAPLPRRRWRVYVRPTSDDSDLVSDATETLRRYAPAAEFVGIGNANRFRCHSRVADSFKSGRVFLAGDAAHACSPSEGHGMNTGLQDAFNLGWKLALACQGSGGSTLLDSYQAERRPVALRIVATGDDFEDNQAMTEADQRCGRDADMQRLLADPVAVHHEAVAAAELDRSYADSDLVMGNWNQHLSPGDRLPTTALVQPITGQPCALHELTHDLGHTLLVIGGKSTPGNVIVGLVSELRGLCRGSAIIDSVIGLCVHPEGGQTGRIDEEIADQLGVEATTILAIRPDRFVGLRHDGVDCPAVSRYIDQFRDA